MKVLIFTRYSCLGSSSRLRFYQYLPYLLEHGIEVNVLPLFRDAYIERLYSVGKRSSPAVGIDFLRRLAALFKASRFELLWIEKELFPWLPPLAEWLMARYGIPYVIDYDDAIFLRYDRSSSMLVRWLLGRKIETVMQGASIVVSGNDYLARLAHLAGARRVEVLPTVVDLRRYSIKAKSSNTAFTVGWIGSPVTAGYLKLIHDALRAVCKSGDVRLLTVGSGPLKLKDVWVETRAWSEESEVREIQAFDVGIMPLPDAPWERGKCGYKLIQYMACGLPVVASPVGVNKNIVNHGVNGFLAENTQHWVKAFQTLRNDKDLCCKMGKQGRARVEREYSLQVTAPRLRNLLLEAKKDGISE